MKRCRCGCMVSFGSICHGCGALARYTQEEAHAELTKRLARFVNKRNVESVRDEIADEVNKFEAHLNAVGAEPKDVGAENVS